RHLLLLNELGGRLDECHQLVHGHGLGLTRQSEADCETDRGNPGYKAISHTYPYFLMTCTGGSAVRLIVQFAEIHAVRQHADSDDGESENGGARFQVASEGFVGIG